METEFEKRISAIINEYSKENESNTPDFILARYLNAALENFNAAINDREQWYGRIQHVEDQHYKIPFDFNDNGTTNPYPPSTTIESVQPFCTPEQNQGVVIGKGETGDLNQDNVFIGNNNGNGRTGNDSTFIGYNASQNNIKK